MGPAMLVLIMLTLGAAPSRARRMHGLQGVQDLVASTARSLKDGFGASNASLRMEASGSGTFMRRNDRSVGLPLEKITGNIAINGVKFTWLGKPLASGSYGIVQMILEVTGSKESPGEIYAGKLIRKTLTDRLSKETQSMIQHEAALQKKCQDNEHIVKIKCDKICDGDDSGCLKGDKLIVMELMEGTLFDKIQRKSWRDLAEKTHAFRQVVDGVKHMHEQGVVHRDLKSGNILHIGDTWKIGDFGLAVEIGQLTKAAGTFLSISPEVLKHSGPGAPYYRADPEADVWSLGILLFEMLFGKTPWTKTQVSEGYPSLDLQYPQELHGHVQLVLEMLQPDAAKRITIAEVACHPLLATAEKLKLCAHELILPRSSVSIRSSRQPTVQHLRGVVQEEHADPQASLPSDNSALSSTQQSSSEASRAQNLYSEAQRMLEASRALNLYSEAHRMLKRQLEDGFEELSKRAKLT